MKRAAAATVPAAGNGDRLSAPATDPPPDATLLTHIDRLMEQLHAQVPKALNVWEVDGIHQARVATRRLKAALDLVNPVVAKNRRKPLARVLRKLRRRLGPLRDADVILEHLDELAASAKYETAAHWVADRLRKQRESLRADSSRKGSAAAVLADLGAWYPVREQIAAGPGAPPGLAGAALAFALGRILPEGRPARR